MRIGICLIRLLKLVFSIVFVWALLVLAWITLPSPVPNDGHTIRIIESGRPAYRVYDVRQLGVFYPDFNAWSKSHFGMRFHLHHTEPSGSSYLIYGGYEDILDDILGTRRPLREIQVNISLSIPDRHAPTTVSEPLVLNVPIMEADLALLPSHLAIADAVMLSHWTHHHSGRIPTRVRTVPSEGRIEIWPDHAHWKNSKAVPPSGLSLSPLVAITINSEDKSIAFDLPTAPISSSPSFFYRVRLVLLPFVESLPYIAMGLVFMASILIPVFSWIWGTFLVTLGVLRTACAIVVGVGAIGFILLVLLKCIGFILCALWKCKQGGQIQLPSDHDDDSINTVIANDLEAQNEITPKVLGDVAQS